MRPFLLLLALVALHAGEGDQLKLDQWFVGHLNGQPSMTMHAVMISHSDGMSTDRLETNIVLNRVLGGAAVNFEVRDTQIYKVNAEGNITEFTFDHVENGQVTSATGTVIDGVVKSTVLKLGRATDSEIKLPEGTQLLGQQASQDVMVQAKPKVGDKQTFSTIALMGSQVKLVKMSATLEAIASDGNMQFNVTMDLVPIPMTMTLSSKGDLIGMTMNMGFINMDFKPSPGPVPLVAAELAAAGLVTAKGPAPASGPHNRYRLPDGAKVPNDEFQQTADGIVTTNSEARPTALADPETYLKAEPQLELDDPDLKKWVDAMVERHQVAKPVLAERLRLAVRGYIIKKDLSMGDGSALETFRSRTGDCTEHANLLAAVLRIAGIPSRVELGMVYAQDFGGWVGHAWNSAYVEGKWIHLDSAYPGIPRSCYLKLGTTSGSELQNTGAAMLAGFSKILGKEVETLSP